MAVGILTWNPIYTRLRAAIGTNQELLLAISPYIKVKPLKKLLDLNKNSRKLKVIVRWSAEDLLSGATDLGIYPLLKDRRIPLFFHPRIHLKLFIFENGHAFHTSGNITSRGFGLHLDQNIEIGCDISLSSSDWYSLYGLLEESNIVDDTVYELSKSYVNQNKRKMPSLPKLDFSSIPPKQFSLLSLPASSHPCDLYDFYVKHGSVNNQPDRIACCTHDLALYGIPEGLSQDDFFSHLRFTFRTQPLVAAIARLLQDKGSVKFGGVAEWLHSRCSDKPVPYRSEIKLVVRRLFSWLAFCFDEISLTQPKHTMVIHWKSAQDKHAQ